MSDEAGVEIRIAKAIQDADTHACEVERDYLAMARAAIEALAAESETDA